jgi:tellurite resistance protein TerC
MIWFWLGFFALVALLLFLDLGVVHRRATEMSLRTAAGWTVAWVALGLSFSGVVFLMYENNWLGVHPTTVSYISAYLLEQALSIDNIFVMSLVFKSFKMPLKYQHRVLFWGIVGAVFFRVVMLGGGAFIANKFDFIFYVFGAYLAFQGFKMFRAEDEGADEMGDNLAVKWLRKLVRVVDGDHGGKLSIRIDGRRALTTVAVCLVVIELTDVVFALDSIPAVLSVSTDTFIMVTSNIFAILGLRSLYFVLAGAMEKFHYLKYALAVLLIFIGAKMLLHRWLFIPDWLSLVVIAGIIGAGVALSLVLSARAPASPSP